VNVFDLFGRLTIDGIEKADAQLSSIEGKFKTAGASMTKAGKTMSMYVTAPLAIMGGMVIKTAADYSQSMAKVNAVTGATAEQFALMNEQAKELGRTTQFTASQVAEAMAFMGMAGMDTNKIMAALPDTLNLAAAGGLEMGQAADIITNIMAGFGMETEELTGAVDVLAKAFTSSNVDLGMLGESMKYAGPIANSFGLSFEETTAIMGSFGNAGIQGSMAGTALRQSIIQLNAKAEEFGLTMYDTSGKMLPMADILEQLEQKGVSAGEMVELFGARAGPAMAALLGTGSEALRDFTTELEAAGGTAEDIAKTQMEGLHGLLITLKSAFEGLQLAIADQLVPILTPLIEKITVAFRWLSQLPGPIQNIIVVVSMLAAATGPLLIAIGLMSQGIGSLIALYKAGTIAMVAHRAVTIASIAVAKVAAAAQWLWNAALTANPIGLVIAAIAGLVAAGIALWRNWDRITEAFSGDLRQMSTDGSTWASNIAQSATDMVEDVERVFGEFMTGLEQQTTDLHTQLDEQVAAQQTATDNIIENINREKDARLAAIDEQAAADVAVLRDQSDAIDDEIAANRERITTEEEDQRVADLQAQIDAEKNKDKLIQLEEDMVDLLDDIHNRRWERDQRAIQDDIDAKIDVIRETADTQKDIAANSAAAQITDATEAGQAVQDQLKVTAALTDAMALSFSGYAESVKESLVNFTGSESDLMRIIDELNRIMEVTGGEQLKMPELGGSSRTGLGNWATGGDITEPTLLYGLKSQKAYAIAGEAGVEHVGPRSQFPDGGGATTVNNQFSIAQLVVREEADVDKIAQKLYRMQSLKGQYA